MFRHAAARTLAVQAAKYFPAFGYCSAASRKNFSLMIRTHTICVHSPDLSTTNANHQRRVCLRGLSGAIGVRQRTMEWNYSSVKERHIPPLRGFEMFFRV